MPRDFIIISLALFFWGLGETTFLSFLPLYLQQLGADPIKIGAIIGGFGLIALLVHIPAGYLSDRIGRRPVLIAGWITGLIATILMALTSILPFFVAAMLLYGSTTFVISPINSYISAARGNLPIQRALTLSSVFYNLGAIFGPIIGGFIGDNYGFRNIFMIAIILFIISNLFIHLIHSQPVEKREPSSDDKNLFSNYRYNIFVVLVLFIVFAMYLPQPLAPNFLQNQRTLNLSQIGMLYSISGIGIVFFNLVIGQMGIRTGFILSQLFMSLFALMLWKMDQYYWFAIGYFFLGNFRSFRAMAAAMVRTLVLPRNMGLAFGVAETMSALSLIIAPMYAGFLYSSNPIQIFKTSTLLILMFTCVSMITLQLLNKSKRLVQQ